MGVLLDANDRNKALAFSVKKIIMKKNTKVIIRKCLRNW